MTPPAPLSPAGGLRKLRLPSNSQGAATEWPQAACGRRPVAAAAASTATLPAPADPDPPAAAAGYSRQALPTTAPATAGERCSSCRRRPPPQSLHWQHMRISSSVQHRSKCGLANSFTAWELWRAGVAGEDAGFKARPLVGAVKSWRLVCQPVGASCSMRVRSCGKGGRLAHAVDNPACAYFEQLVRGGRSEPAMVDAGI